MPDQVRRVRHRHGQDLTDGGGDVPLPPPLLHQGPAAGRDWQWPFVLPSVTVRRDADGRAYRGNADKGVLDRAIRLAAVAACLSKRVICLTLRHSSAPTSPRTCWSTGYDIRQVRTLLGHDE